MPARRAVGLILLRGLRLLGACFVLIALQSGITAAQQSDLPALNTVTTENSCPQARESCCCCGTCETARPSCPTGYSLYDDYCLPSCPEGFIRYPGEPGVCLPPYRFGCPDGFEPVPLPSCPAGYHRNLRHAGRCVADPQVPAQCPPGLNYSLLSGQCSVECPRGTYVGSDGLCHSYYQHECPQGYRRNPGTGACMPPGEWPPTYHFVCLPVCPQGLIRDPFEPTRCVPPRHGCPQGYENVHGLCIPVCERGSRRDSYGYCVPPECPPGTYADLRGRCLPVGCPEGTILNERSGACEPPPPPQEKCKPGFVYNRELGACEPERPRPKPCPEGYIRLESGKCVRPGTTVPLRPVCPSGEVYNQQTNRCMPILRVPRACPTGMIYDARLRRCVVVRLPPINRLAPPPRIKQLAPLPRIKPQVLRPRGCPSGTFLDKNGRCRKLR